MNKYYDYGISVEKKGIKDLILTEAGASVFW